MKVNNLLMAVPALLLGTGWAVAQEQPYGYVNFNLKPAPVYWAPQHELSLYGCQTEVTTREWYRDGQNNLVWGEDDQVLPEVPYGYQEDEFGNTYYVSKYYMASPPVFAYDGKDPNAPAVIGLVIPDRFTFFGQKPVQIVNLDYSILEPVYLSYVSANYGYDDGVHPSCDSLGLDLVPLNMACTDFPWLLKSATPTILDAKGASGIARLRNEPDQNRVFLAHTAPDSGYLDCDITILDDILLYHEVFFVTEEGLSKSLSLTDFYLNEAANGQQIQLACRTRSEPPAGCQPPAE